jgi:hypothetical protein
MARKFTLQPLRRYDVKPLKKPHKRNLPLDMPCHEKTKQHSWGSTQRSLAFKSVILPLRHTYTRIRSNNKN